MDATPFAKILTDLIVRLPGAYACALVDLGGETVDYAGVADPFDVKVAGRAHANHPERPRGVRRARAARSWVVLRGAQRSFVARRLPEDTPSWSLLRRRAGFTASARAFAACERALSGRPGGATWTLGPLVSDRGRGRPTRAPGSLSSRPGRRGRGLRLRDGSAARTGLSRAHRDGKRAHARPRARATPGTPTRTWRPRATPRDARVVTLAPERAKTPRFT